MSRKTFITFSNGKTCPLLGLGTYKSESGEVRQAIKDAVDIGYRHFDCAYFYENEKEIGDALNEKMKEGVVSRDDLFITSKLWNTFHKKEHVMPGLKRTLANLGIAYLDLFLIHWPTAFKEGEKLMPEDETGKILFADVHYTETWKAMEDCVKEGLTKSIGVSNFNSAQIQDILNIATIPPVNNQVECHPYFNQSKLINFCKSKGITVTAYSPLGSPYKMKPGDSIVLEDPKIKKLAEKYNRSPAQIAIRYQIERDVIAIPKSVNKSRIQSNFDSLSFTLTKDDLKILDSLNKPDGRIIPFEATVDHKNYPFKAEF